MSEKNTEIKSPSKSTFSSITSSLGSFTKSLGSAASSVAKSVTSTASDAVVATPKMNKLGAEQRFDLEDETVHSSKDCYVYVSCQVAKEIRDKLKQQLEQAGKEFNKTLGKLEDPKGSIADLKKFSEQVNVKATAVQNAKNTYDKKCNAIIVLNPTLDCKLSVSNTVDEQGQPINKIAGKILEINPKTREIKVEGTGHIKTSKGIVEHKVKMSSTSISSSINISINNLCVGGSTADDNNQGQCFNTQTGGNKHQNKKTEILEISSDIGICE